MADEQTVPTPPQTIIVHERSGWLIKFSQAISVLFEACSLSGAIICFLALFIIIGLDMQWSGNAGGEKVWAYFGSAFTAFMTGKSLGASETLSKLMNNKDGQ